MPAMIPAEVFSPTRSWGALLAKGFRPFFLCAAAYAVIAVPLFLWILDGGLAASGYLPSIYWHAHEMVFGFTAAVLAGFLLTAVENWTQRRTVEGPLLAALVGLWAAGRVVMFVPDVLPRYVPAAVELAFLPALWVACARPLLAAKNRRNYAFLAILAGLWLANAAVHAAALGFISPELQRRGSWLGVDLLVIALVVVSGRVVPMFTRNATGSSGVSARPTLERLATASVVLLALLEAVGSPPRTLGYAALVAALLVGLRMRSWGSFQALREPLLWILHAGGAWLALGLALRGAASFTSLPLSSGLHALTAGALGAFTLGMMTRVGLGHTGRNLAVPRRVTLAFALVVLAGVVRVLAPLNFPSSMALLVISGAMWSAAFALYLIAYAPALSAPRLDGKPG